MAVTNILIVGSKESHCIESYYAKYLNELGVHTTIFNSADYYELSLFNRVRNKLGDLSFYKQLNKSLIAFCSNHKPQVVWIFKGIEFFPETLTQIKKMGIYLVNYNPDHPFIRTFASGGGKNIEECLPLYDFHFCYSIDLCEKIKNDFSIPTAWLPFGFELSQRQLELAMQEPQVNTVCFLGNPDKYRTATINTIANAGIPIHIYGHDWHKWLKASKNITLHNAVYGDLFWQKLRCYKMQLNVFRPHNEGSHNMRTFEVPAVGGIELAPDSKEHSILKLSTAEEKLVRENALQKSFEKEYSYKARAKTVSVTLNEIL
jgi:spore maturation protein CgeB